MRRSLVLTLSASALLGLSCGLPRAAAPPAGPVAEAVAPAPARDAEVEAVADFLASRRRTRLSRAETDALARVIVEESRRHEIESQLVLAVMHVESRFDPFAVSPVGAMGLMQILPSTGEEVATRLGIHWRGAQTLFDPVANVRLGVAYLRELHSRYGDDTRIALAAYNWGPGRIDRRLRRGNALPEQYPSLVLEAHAETVRRPS